MTKVQSLAEYLGTVDPAKPEVPVKPFKVPKTGEEFARAIVCSEDYRRSLKNMIFLGILPPAVHSWLLCTAFGKPIDRLEVKDTTDPIDTLTAEQCEERAMHLLELARSMKVAEFAEPRDEDDDDVDHEVLH